MRFILYFIIRNSLTLLSLVLLVLSFFLVTTEIGLRYVLQSVPHLTSCKLSVKEAHGNLYSAFALQNLNYEDAQQKICIESCKIQWNPLGLLLNKLTLSNVELKNAYISIKGHSTPSSQALNFNALSHISIKQFTIDHLTLVKGRAELKFNGGYQKEWNGEWQIKIPDLSDFTKSISGSLESEGKMSGTLLSPTVTSHLTAQNIHFQDMTIKSIEGVATFPLKRDSTASVALTVHDLKSNKFPLKKLNLEGQGRLTSNQSVFTQLKLKLNDQYVIAGDIKLPKFTSIFDMTQPVSAKISSRTSQLEWLTQFYSEIKNPTGKLDASVAVTGTLQNPLFDSKIRLSQGQLNVPSIGILIKNIHLDAIQQKKSEFAVKGRFQSGEGTGEVTGLIRMDPNHPLTLTFKGNHLQCVNLDEYKIIASPTLTLDFNHQLKIEGDIPIISAEIKPKRFSSTLSLPEEVIFIDNKKHEAPLPLDVAIKINLLLSDKIHIAYKDLQTQLKGKLFINWTPKRNSTAIGELYAVNGTYSAYGQTLSIINGRLIYTGGFLSNPGLNIRAGKQVKTVVLGGQSSFTDTGPKPVYAGTEMITVGFQILGTFDKQNISLFSAPSGLSQNDILSYLTFGYPQSQISTQQNKLLLKAVSAINFSGKQNWTNFADQIQSKLGLTEMNVESTQVFNPSQGKLDSTTSFVVGKQIFSNLYAHYSIGIFDRMSTLNLRYQLSKHFAIQSETNQLGNGADLLYSIERD